MRSSLPPSAIERARQARQSATDAESLLWYALRERLGSAKFRRQVPFGRYRADFASHRAKLVVELDGSHHMETADRDDARTRFLNAEGYRVLRFWNNEVMRNLDGVLDVISKALSPCGRGSGEGPAASAAEETFRLAEPVGEPALKARRSRAPA